MILEVAILDVIAGQESKFQTDFAAAQKIIASMRGYIGHQLQRCIEKPSRYLLLVNWQQLEDHTVGFRESAEYQTWKALLHHYYEPFPEVEHYELVFGEGRQ
jgi:heme-degrading monooxygenase HmoA